MESFSLIVSGMHGNTRAIFNGDSRGMNLRFEEKFIFYEDAVVSCFTQFSGDTGKRLGSIIDILDHEQALDEIPDEAIHGWFYETEVIPHEEQLLSEAVKNGQSKWISVRTLGWILFGCILIMTMTPLRYRGDKLIVTVGEATLPIEAVAFAGDFAIRISAYYGMYNLQRIINGGEERKGVDRVIQNMKKVNEVIGAGMIATLISVFLILSHSAGVYFTIGILVFGAQIFATLATFLVTQSLFFTTAVFFAPGFYSAVSILSILGMIIAESGRKQSVLTTVALVVMTCISIVLPNIYGFQIQMAIMSFVVNYSDSNTMKALTSFLSFFCPSKGISLYLQIILTLKKSDWKRNLLSFVFFLIVTVMFPWDDYEVVKKQFNFTVVYLLFILTLLLSKRRKVQKHFTVILTKKICIFLRKKARSLLRKVGRILTGIWRFLSAIVRYVKRVNQHKPTLYETGVWLLLVLLSFATTVAFLKGGSSFCEKFVLGFLFLLVIFLYNWKRSCSFLMSVVCFLGYLFGFLAIFLCMLCSSLFALFRREVDERKLRRQEIERMKWNGVPTRAKARRVRRTRKKKRDNMHYPELLGAERNPCPRQPIMEDYDLWHEPDEYNLVKEVRRDGLIARRGKTVGFLMTILILIILSSFFLPQVHGDIEVQPKSRFGHILGYGLDLYNSFQGGSAVADSVTCAMNYYGGKSQNSRQIELCSKYRKDWLLVEKRGFSPLEFGKRVNQYQLSQMKEVIQSIRDFHFVFERKDEAFYLGVKNLFLEEDGVSLDKLLKATVGAGFQEKFPEGLAKSSFEVFNTTVTDVVAMVCSTGLASTRDAFFKGNFSEAYRSAACSFSLWDLKSWKMLDILAECYFTIPYQIFIESSGVLGNAYDSMAGIRMEYWIALIVLACLFVPIFYMVIINLITKIIESIFYILFRYIQPIVWIFFTLWFLPLNPLTRRVSEMVQFLFLLFVAFSTDAGIFRGVFILAGIMTAMNIGFYIVKHTIRWIRKKRASTRTPESGGTATDSEDETEIEEKIVPPPKPKTTIREKDLGEMESINVPFVWKK